jgi:hypothetical protein
VMAMLFAFNGNTAMMIMKYMTSTDLLVRYLREHPKEWKLIQDGIRSVILGSDVLSQMLESDVGAKVRDADVVPAQELDANSVDSEHGTHLDNIEESPENIEAKQVPAPKPLHFCYKQAHVFRGTCDVQVWKPQDPDVENSHIADYQLLSLDRPAPDMKAKTPDESDGHQTFMLVTRRVFSGAALSIIPIKCEIQCHIFKKYRTDLDESSKEKHMYVPLFENKDVIGSICVRHLIPDPIMGSGTLWDADLYLKEFKETDFP